MLPGFFPGHSVSSFLPACARALTIGACFVFLWGGSGRSGGYAQTLGTRSGAGDLPPDALFAQLYYAAVIDGERDRAATGFSALYVDPQLPGSLRARAAWQAGRAFEGSGKVLLALKAYEWLAQFDDADATLRLAARERIGSLGVAASGSLPNPDRVPFSKGGGVDFSAIRLGAVREVSVRTFLEKRIEQVRVESERRAAVDEALRVASEERAVAHELKERLAARGVHLGFESTMGASIFDATASAAPGARSPIEARAGPAELIASVFGMASHGALVREAVAARFVESALHAVIEGRQFDATQTLGIAISLGLPSDEAAALREVVDPSLSPRARAALARQRLLDRQERIVIALRRELARTLEESALVTRTELAMRDLFDAGLRRLEAQPRYALLDPEVAELALRLRIRWTTICEAREALEALWRWHVEDSAEMIARTVRFVERSEDARRHARRPPSVEGTSVPAAILAVARELEAEARALAGEGAESEEASPAKERLKALGRQKALLAVWFPEVVE